MLYCSMDNSTGVHCFISCGINRQFGNYIVFSNATALTHKLEQLALSQIKSEIYICYISKFKTVAENDLKFTKSYTQKSISFNLLVY